MSNANEKRSLPRHALRWIQTEIDFWRQNSLVDAETAARLRALYVESPDAAPTSAPVLPFDRRFDFGRFLVFATATLGALALGIALYFVLSLTWEHLGKSCKIGVLVGSLAVVYLGGFAARAFRRPNFSAALFFLGAFVFGLSVWQFAEIFRFEIALPTTCWLWGALAFAVAYFGDRAPTHYLAAAIFVVWTFAEINFDRPTAFSPALLDEQLPNAAYSLPIFAALGYRWAVRRGASGVQLLHALLGVFWAATQYFVWMGTRDAVNDFFGAFYLFFLAGFVYFVVSKLVADRFVASKLRLLSVATLFGLLLIFSRFECYEEGVSSSFSNARRWATLVFFAVFGAIALATFFAAWRKRPDLFAKGPARRGLLVSPIGVAILTIFPFLCSFYNLVGGDVPPSFDAREEIALGAAVWTNVLVLAVAVVSFLVGAFRSASLYWFGVFYFLIWLTLRYFAFDLDDATLAACFFGAISLALFAAAFFLARLRARLDAAPEETPSTAPLVQDAEAPQTVQSPQTARREPAFVAFLADALDAPTAAKTPAVSGAVSDPDVETDAKSCRFKTCALAAVVAAQFAILGFIAVEASRPFVPVESFVVEATAVRVPTNDSQKFFGRDDVYLALAYPFAAQQPDLAQKELSGDAPLVADERRGLGTVYVVLRRDPETDVAWATRITSTRPASLASDELLLVGRRWSRRTKANGQSLSRLTDVKTTFPGIDAFPSVPKEFAEEFKKAESQNGVWRGGTVRVRVKIETAADGSARIAGLEPLPSSTGSPEPPRNRRVFEKLR